MVEGIIFGSSAVILIAMLLIFSGSRKKHLSTVLKVLAVTYFAWSFMRYFMSDAFIWVINKGMYGGIYYETTDILQSILRWGHYTSYVVLPMAIFFKSRLFKNIAIYFTLPFTIISVFYFSDFITYFMAPGGRGIIRTTQEFREFYFIIELVLGIVLPLSFVVLEKHLFNFKDKKEILNYFVSLPFILILLMPVYIPQSLIGYTTYSITAMTLGNFLWILITIIEIMVLYWIFRFKGYRERFMLVMLLSLGLFMHYNSLYLMGFSIARLPIQLCNLGAYFFVLALLIKNVKFFNFVFLANIMGTIIAMVMPDTSGGVAGFWNMHFLLEHMQVLVVPALCMMLRIFPRINKNAFKHLIVGFTIYFMFSWISGTILNGYALEGGYGRVNYFYLFDIKKMLDYFPFLSFAQNFRYEFFTRFEIFPVFAIIIYSGFLFLCLLLYFAIIKLYDFADDHFTLRQARIDMYEKFAKKKYKGQRFYFD